MPSETLLIVASSCAESYAAVHSMSPHRLHAVSLFDGELSGRAFVSIGVRDDDVLPGVDLARHGRCGFGDDGSVELEGHSFGGSAAHGHANRRDSEREFGGKAFGGSARLPERARLGRAHGQ